MSKVYVKTMTRGRDRLVAVCDESILGETLEGGRVPFKVSEGFYKGTLSDVEEAIAAMRQATICNLVGKIIVEAAIECDLVHERAVIYFGDIPHAQIVKF
ncbi:DUF424 family protein [Candidatus Bathyarchaeota archaeon]|jgi:uncharacterized protein|nr:DUF424 family protein [Candidatus Bathyarchaeota archaeon]MBT4319925.1 DUF424 family protein [Candidatus Bathyarchaeota archaeon]MBT4422847.1 DUF424 family protein [Candidatus Bathyarchaeota archaeon]MBT5642274.1 DUF424 family protein [Candidatus Bathyarchaeota archaeon]MBT6605762.1 DUF424 family protein [Candidatus Bathyarchaeota archaeon]